MSMYYRHRPPSGGEALATSVVGGALVVMLALTLVTVYLLVRAANLVIKAFAHHPKHPALWLSLLGSLTCFVGAGLLGLVAQSHHVAGPPPSLQVVAALLMVLGSLGLLVLLLVARVLEILHDELFQVDRGESTLVDTVLRRPWWDQP